MKRVILPALALFACAKDPVYLAPDPAAVEVNGGDNGPSTATTSITIPILRPTDADYDKITEIADTYMLQWDMVPSVRRDEIEMEIEWTVKNLDDTPGTAVVSVLGANEFFSYDPNAFVLDPEEDPPPPPLLGGSPVDVPALGSVNGVFREDELSEAAQDLDALTRFGITPQRAMLTQWESGDIVDPMGMFLWPSIAVPALIELDVSLAADTHMVLEYVVRVRDHTNRLDANNDRPWELVSPAANGAFVPPPPTTP